MWVFNRIPHTRLRRQVHHLVKFFLGEQLLNALAIDKVHSNHAETRHRLKNSGSRLFQCNVVVVIEVV